MYLQRPKVYAEEKRTRIINTWVSVLFLLIHVIYEFWGIKNETSTIIFNVTDYGFLCYVFARVFIIDKDFVSLFGAMFWGYYFIVELWIGLTG